jgi:positive phototaxis protein PixI
MLANSTEQSAAEPAAATALEAPSAPGLMPNPEQRLNDGPEQSPEQGLEQDAAAIAPALSEAQFLQIYLSPDRPLLLPVTTLVEIMKIPMGQIAPMFQMPAWVVGVYNWRGDVLWMADLDHFLRQRPWYSQDEAGIKHTAVVVRSQPSSDAPAARPLTLGWVLHRVEGMVSLPSAEIQPAASLETVEPELLPFLSGIWQDKTGFTHWILDGSGLFAAMAALK